VAKRLILFRTEHSRRVFVPKVDFVTAPGTSPEGVYRLGGLHAVVTDLCVFEFDRGKGRLELGSVHPGVSLADVEAKTGFPLHAPTPLRETATPTDAELALLRGPVREELQTFYPEFVKQQS
jgi:glutaconate CoA-transferase subunit B